MRRTTDDDPGQRHGYRISIHALHEESDRPDVSARLDLIISIHALHEESDVLFLSNAVQKAFQSTLSMRRATYAPLLVTCRLKDFNPRSP